MMEIFAGVEEIWNKLKKMVYPKDWKRKSELEIGKGYAQIVALFKMICEQYKYNQNSTDYSERSFSNKVVLLAIEGLHYTFSLILENLNQAWEAEDNSTFFEEAQRHIPELNIFNDFFFILAKLKCNPILPEKQLSALQETIKLPFKFLQHRLLNESKSSIVTTENPLMKMIANFTYFVMQTIAALAIFGENLLLSQKKYEFILSQFQVALMLMHQVPVFEALYSFESVWQQGFKKYSLLSFGNKRLGVFVMDDKLQKETVMVNLKFVIVTYHYKILKIIAQRLKMPYDESLINIFSKIIQKNNERMEYIIKHPNDETAMKKMLLLNENLNICKSFIIDLLLLSDNLDPIQRKKKFDSIKELINESLVFSLKLGLYSNLNFKKVKGYSFPSILKPEDFVAKIIKTLLLFKTIINGDIKINYAAEIIALINTLILNLLTRPLIIHPIESHFLYKIYLLEYLNQWDNQFLQNHRHRYMEAICSVFSDTEESQKIENATNWNILISEVNKYTIELCIKLVNVDPLLLFERIGERIKDSYSSTTLLKKNLYVLTCIILKKKVMECFFDGLIKADQKMAKYLFNELEDVEHIQYFLQKGSLQDLFGLYFRELSSYMKTKTDHNKRKTDLPSGGTPGSPTAAMSLIVQNEYMFELQTTVSQCKEMLETVGFYFLSLLNIPIIARYFIMQKLLNYRDITKIICSKNGRVVFNKMMRICAKCIRGIKSFDSQLIGNYVSIIWNTLRNLIEPSEEEIESNVKLKESQHKEININLLYSLRKIIDAEEDYVPATREYLFDRGVAALLVEICQFPIFKNDFQYFQETLMTLKNIIKGNNRAIECSTSSRYIFSFMRNQFRHLLCRENNFPIMEKCLICLLEIAFEHSFDPGIPEKLILKESLSLETYYSTISFFFKKCGIDPKIYIYVISPLEATRDSLFSLSFESRSTIISSLTRILCAISQNENDEFASLLANHIGIICSANATRKQLKFLLQRFLTLPNKSSPPNMDIVSRVLVNSLVNIISGQNIDTFFYFDGIDSQIELQSPLTFRSTGFLFAGNFRLEYSSQSKVNCILSFLKIASHSFKGIEITIRNSEFVVSLFSAKDKHLDIMIKEVEIKSGKWFSMMLAVSKKELVLYIDESQFIYQISDYSDAVVSSYNKSYIGVSYDPRSGSLLNYFFGEMSTLFFFNYNTFSREDIRKIAFNIHSLPYILQLESLKKEELGRCLNSSLVNSLNMLPKDLIGILEYLLSPQILKLSSINRTGRIFKNNNISNPAVNFKNVQIFCNRPGKDIFFAIGGLETCIPILSRRIGGVISFPSVEAKTICNGVLRIIHCLFQFSDIQVLQFFAYRNGISMIQQLMEKAGRKNQFSREFVDLLFNVISDSTQSEIWNLGNTDRSITEALVETLILNLDIWGRSTSDVQLYLLFRVKTFLAQNSEKYFCHGEHVPALLNICKRLTFESEEQIKTNEEDEKEEELSIVLKAKKIIKLMIYRGLVHCDNKIVIASFINEFFSNKVNDIYETDLLDIALNLELYPYVEINGKRPKSPEKNSTSYNEKHWSFFKEYILKESVNSPPKEQPFLSFLFNHFHYKLQMSRDTILLNNKDQIIASKILELLFTIDWERISIEVKKRLGCMLIVRTENKGYACKLYNCLQPSSIFSSTKEIIQAFILKSLLNDNEVPPILIGTEIYRMLLKPCWKNQADFFKFDVKKKQFDKSYLVSFYLNILPKFQNLLPETQTLFLEDFLKFAQNSGFSKILLQLLSSLVNLITSHHFEEFNDTFLFAISLAASSQWNDHILTSNFFFPLYAMISSDVLNVLLLLLKKLYGSSFSSEGIFNLIELSYFLEDRTIKDPEILDLELFASILGYLIIILEANSMLYFAYPFFDNVPPVASEYEYQEISYQREGGSPRIILKLLFGMINRTKLDNPNQLNLLKFFIFHKKTTYTKILQWLGLPLSQEDKMYKANFLNSSTINPKILSLLIAKQSLCYHKTIKELQNTIKDTFSGQTYRKMLLIMLVAQSIIYSSLNISSFDEVHYHCLDSIRKFIPMPISITELTKILGKVISYSVDSVNNIINEFREIDKIPIPSNIQTELDDLLIGGNKSVVNELTDRIVIPSLDKSASETRAVSWSSSIPKTNRMEVSVHQSMHDPIQIVKVISNEYKRFKANLISGDTYSRNIIILLLDKIWISSIQIKLHIAYSTDYININRHIMQLLNRRDQLSKKHCDSLSAKTKSELRKLESIEKTLLKIKNKLPPSQRISAVLKPILTEKNKIMSAIENIPDKQNIKIYQIVTNYYSKLLLRCPLYTKTRSCLENSNYFNQFMKIALERDNLGRFMRMKPIKHPLEDSDIVKGISYVRTFFLKRILLLFMLKPQYNKLTEIFSQFLVSDAQSELLTKIMRSIPAKTEAKGFPRHASTPKVSLSKRNTERLPNTLPMINKAQSRMSLNNAITDSEVVQCNFDCEIVKLDKATFGILTININGIYFQSEQKSLKDAKYKLGSPNMIKFLSTKKKFWKCDNISQIVGRKFNMVQQAVEIFLKNNKTVLFVLFNEENLEKFLFYSQQLFGMNQKINIIFDTTIEFIKEKICEKWRKGKLSNFEYIIHLNHYSSRTPRDLSQYPIFPWIIQDYDSNSIPYMKPLEFRPFHLSIAGLNENKREAAVMKYENTTDLPLGPFQFGVHYLPPRAVLTYLMRVQPYYGLLLQYDGGQKDPARCLHVLGSFWNNIQCERDANFELIPEFYYNPEIFSNHFLNFGCKQTQDGIVRVGKIVLPPWAQNKHHFVFCNYMALEHPYTRERLQLWIDLIFGYKQHKGGEVYNLFKPHTDESMVRLRRKELTEEDITEISEFGHNPTQLFSRPHEPADKKEESAIHIFEQLSICKPYFEIVALKGGEKEGGIVLGNWINKEKNLLSLTSENKLYQHQIVPSAGKPLVTISTIDVFPTYNIHENKLTYSIDPYSVFAIYGNYFIQTRSIDNSFKLYDINKKKLRYSIIFHRNCVGCLAIYEPSKLLFTGDMDGMVAVWSLESLNSLSIPYFTHSDHNLPIISLDCNFELDLVLSSTQKSCCLRVISTQRFFKKIRPKLEYYNIAYKIYKAKLSARGYIVFLVRSTFIKYEKDLLLVYSINGEWIGQKALEDQANTILFDPSQYFVCIGGCNGVVRIYNIITLDEVNYSGNLIGSGAIASLNYFDSGRRILIGYQNSTFAWLQAGY